MSVRRSGGSSIHGRRRDANEKLLASIDGEEGIAADVARLRPANEQQVVVLIDSVARPEIVHGLFGRLRDEVWQLPITWIVSGHQSARGRCLDPPADSFFDAVVELDELSVDYATDLLRRRARSAPIDDPVREVLLGVAATLGQQVSPRTPRNLLAAAREVLLAGDDPTQWVTIQHALRLQAAGLSRPARMLFTELMDLAPVSASDKRLLERLGWTRTRASQVFKQLEEAGLVVVTEEAPNGPGRPRKLYAPNAGFHAGEQSGASQDRVRTAAELEALSPDERDAAVSAGFATDPAAAPPDLLARARRNADARVAATEGADQS